MKIFFRPVAALIGLSKTDNPATSLQDAQNRADAATGAPVGEDPAAGANAEAQQGRGRRRTLLAAQNRGATTLGSTRRTLLGGGG